MVNAMNTIHAMRPEETTVDQVRSSDDPMVIENYLTDESNSVRGDASRIYYPESEAQIAAILHHCVSNAIPVTTSGGGTGITSSRVPLGGVVLSTEALVRPVRTSLSEEKELVSGRKLLYLNAETLSATAGPAITLQEVADMLAPEKLAYAPNPTETSAFLGGTVAANASGSRTFHYGPTRDWVERLRVVLSCGEILDIKRGAVKSENGEFQIVLASGDVLVVTLPTYTPPRVKNAAGYYVEANGTDLIDLFIGSEGTLGIITEIQIGLITLPEDIFACTAYFAAMEDALAFVIASRQARCNNESPVDALALEYFDDNSLELLRKKYPRIPMSAGAAVYFEQAIEGDEDQILEAWVELMEEAGSIEDFSGFAARDRSEMVDIRHSLPELINEFVRLRGLPKVATDLAVPDNTLDEMMHYYKEVGNTAAIPYCVFGHIGNNHLHFNFLPTTEEQKSLANTYVKMLAEKAVQRGGTISAEHGVGKKTYSVDGESIPYLMLMYGESGLIEIARTKRQLDPAIILNRGSVVPTDYVDKV